MAFRRAASGTPGAASGAIFDMAMVVRVPLQSTATAEVAGSRRELQRCLPGSSFKAERAHAGCRHQINAVHLAGCRGAAPLLGGDWRCRTFRRSGVDVGAERTPFDDDRCQ